MDDLTELWLVFELGGSDDPPSLYGVFTTEEKARRAADVCEPTGYKSCLNVEPIVADAIYKTDLGKFYDVPTFFSYPQAEPNTDWGRVVVEAGTDRLEIEP